MSSTESKKIDIPRTEKKLEQAQTSQPAKRAEILFFYDCRMSNPNGDPNENRPRIDRITKKNYVTEFRLKRTIRDYMAKVMNKPSLMKQVLVDPTNQTGALKRLEELAASYIKEEKIGGKTIQKIDRRRLIQDHIDIKLFGILFAVKDKLNFKQIGPVQFSIGQSLNDNIEEISVHMARIVPNTKNEQGESLGGTFGEKYVVRYSFIGFHGFVNDNVGKEKDVDLKENDVRIMLTAMWRGTDSLITSSKIGQKSRLIVKVNYKDNGYLGDLDLKCTLESSKEVQQNISDVKLNVAGLFGMLSDNNKIIESVEYEYNSDLVCKYGNEESDFEKLIQGWSNDSKVSVIRLNL
jgi:CRISPR-associated protein Csh2